MTGQHKTKLKKNGFSMVEVLIALLLLGLVGGGIMAVLANSSSHTITADVRATAESIARSQLESIKGQAYDTTSPYTYSKIDFSLFRGPWDTSIAVTLKATGLQKISVTVIHDGQPVLTLEGYKSP
jgi:Tfp pilus assembly protein PilV